MAARGTERSGVQAPTSARMTESIKSSFLLVPNSTIPFLAPCQKKPRLASICDATSFPGKFSSLNKMFVKKMFSTFLFSTSSFFPTDQVVDDLLIHNDIRSAAELEVENIMGRRVRRKYKPSLSSSSITISHHHYHQRTTRRTDNVITDLSASLLMGTHFLPMWPCCPSLTLDLALANDH